MADNSLSLDDLYTGASGDGAAATPPAPAKDGSLSLSDLYIPDASAPQSDGIGTKLKETGKAIAAGAIEGTGSLARGAADLNNRLSQAMNGPDATDADSDKNITAAQQAAESYVAPAKGYEPENSKIGTYGRMAGQFVPAALAAATPLGPLAGPAIVGGMQGVDQGHQTAVAAGQGGTGADDALMVADGLINGAANMIPLANLGKVFGAEALAGIKGFATRTLATSIASGGTMMAADALQDAAAKYTVNPDAVIGANAGSNFVSGAILGAGAHALLHEPFRHPPAPAAATPDEPATPPVAGLLGHTTRLPDQSGVDINAPPPEPQRALPPPGSSPTSTADGAATMDADPQGTPIQRARYGVQRLNPGDPVTNSVIANIAGIPKNDVAQIKAIRQELIARNWVDPIGPEGKPTRWVRSADPVADVEQTPAGTPVPEPAAPGNDPTNPRPDMTNIGGEAKAVADAITAGKTPDEAVADGEAQKPAVQPEAPAAQPEQPANPPVVAATPEPAKPVEPPAAQPEQPAIEPAMPAPEPAAPPAPAAPVDNSHLPVVGPLIKHIADNPKWSINPQNVAKKFGIDKDQAMRVLGAAVGRPDAGFGQFFRKVGGTKKNPVYDTVFRRAPQDRGPVDIVTFLARQGGIKPVGETKDWQRPVPGSGSFITESGLSLDAAREKAQEAGYLKGDPTNGPATSTTNDLIAAVEKSLAAGKNNHERSYSWKDERWLALKAEAERAKAAAAGDDPTRRQAEAEAEQLGIVDPHKMSDDELRDALHNARSKAQAEADAEPDDEHGDAWEPEGEAGEEKAGPAVPPDDEDPFADHEGGPSSVDPQAPVDIDPPFEHAPAFGEAADREADRAAPAHSEGLDDRLREDTPNLVDHHAQDAGDRSDDLSKRLAEDGIGPGTPGRLMRAIGRWVSDKGPIEHGVSVDMNTGKVIQARTDGKAAEVSLGGAAITAANDPNNRIVFQHNHPRNTALSPPDIGQLARKGLQWVVAHGQDGAFSAARLTDALRAVHPNGAAWLGQVAATVSKAVEGQLVKEIEAKNISAIEAIAYHADLANHVLANHGLVDYVSNLNSAGLPKAAVARVMEAGAAKARKAYAIAFKEQIPDDPTGLRNRPAAPVRAEVAADRVFGRDEEPAGGQAGAPDGAAGDGGGAAGNRGEAGGVKPRANPPRLLPGQKQGSFFEGLHGEKLEDAVMQESARVSKEREESYPDFVKRTMSKMAGPRDDRSVYDKVKDSLQSIKTADAWTQLYQKTFNRNYTPDEARAAKVLRDNGVFDKHDFDSDGTLGAHASASSAAAFYHQSAALVSKMIDGGTLVYKDGAFTVQPFFDRNGRAGGWGNILSDIANHPAGNLMREFATYTNLVRDKRLAQERNPDGTPRSKTWNADSAATLKHLAQQFPEFEGVRQDMNKYNTENLKALRDAGRIDDKTFDKWTKDADYSPFYRQIQDDVLGTGNLNAAKGPSHMDALVNDRGFKKLTGGDAPLGDFLSNWVTNMQAVTASATKNVAAQRYLRDAEVVGNATRVRGNPIKLESDPRVVRSYENGKAVYHRIDSKITYNAIMGMESRPLNGFVKFLGKPANLLRMTTTHMPNFLLWTHPMRESFVAWMTTKGFVPPVVSAIKGTYNVLAHTDLADKMERHGVVGGFDLKAGNADAVGKKLQAIFDKDKTGVQGGIAKFWRGWGRLQESADAGVRTQVYQTELKRLTDLGLRNPEATAAMKALSNSVNFGQRGSSEILHWASIAIPFLNARLQGLDALGRAAFSSKESGMQFAGKALMLMGLTAGYYAMVRSNPMYQRASQQMKDDNFLLPIGKETMIAMPAPFEAGIVFKRTAEHALRYLMGDDTGSDVAKAMERAVFDTMKVTPLPQAALPLAENMTNYSTFTGQHIVPDRLSRLVPAQQYTDKTSEAGKAIGAATNISPMYIDHAIQGYFGSLASAAMFITNAAVREFSNGPAHAATPATSWPIAASIIKTSANLGSAQVDQMYELKTQVDQVVASYKNLIKTGDAKGAQEFRAANAPAFGVSAQLDHLGKQVSQTFAQDRAIQTRQNMSPDAKRQALNNNDARRQALTANIQAIRQRASQ